VIVLEKVQGLHEIRDPDCLCFFCRDACYTTQPVELLNPESMLTFGSDYVSGPRNLSNTTPSLNFRGHQTPTAQSETDIEQSEFHDNGTIEGTPGRSSNGGISKMNRQLSFDSVADDRLERLSIAESEGELLLITRLCIDLRWRCYSERDSACLFKLCVDCWFFLALRPSIVLCRF
jgi:hypothetical protein